MNHSFVILHYKVADFTIKCIDLLLDMKNTPVQIIVIDNKSNNGSLEELIDHYKSLENIHIFSLDYNVGFAKANNFGFSLAKHLYSADFITVINNDVFIEDTAICSKIEQIYEEIKFDILGPDIITRSGGHQNPNYDIITNIKQLRRIKRKLRIRLRFMALYVPYKNLKNKLYKGKQATLLTTQSEPLVSKKDVPLHGACLVFSPQFVKKYEIPFCPDTFLYHEEDILYHWKNTRELLTYFASNIRVLHHEDAATDAVLTTPKEKRKFQLACILHSLDVLEREMSAGSNNLV